ncbi:hypothetical protein [Echinicola sp. 20G]|uniref:hypothetical protein n=1 Tax=Echinicola sp. 20G TaxID=2781961 RepID=UPI001F270D90|nr:hypothetical protein [Echinicola sp. 20G]
MSFISEGLLVPRTEKLFLDLLVVKPQMVFYYLKALNGSINSAVIIDKVSVTPNPRILNGNTNNHIRGYNKSKSKASGQQSTKRMVQRTRLMNSFIN